MLLKSSIFIFVLIAAIVYSAPLPDEKTKIITGINSIWQKEKKHEQLISLAAVPSNGFKYAIDTQYAVTQQNFNCLYKYGYSLAILRIYSGQGSGQGDSTGVQNVKYAVNGKNYILVPLFRSFPILAGFGYEVYVEPSPSSSKSADSQLSEALKFANNNGLKLNRVWLKVSSPINWNSNTYNNVNFVNNFIKAGSKNGVSVGIFTNWYDWNLITANAQVSNVYALWYWAQNGFGQKGETSKDASGD